MLNNLSTKGISSTMEPDQEPFLRWDQEHTSRSEGDSKLSNPIQDPAQTSNFKHAIFHILLVLLYTTIFVFWTASHSSQFPNYTDSLSDLKKTFKPHLQKFTNSTYSGLPSEELDGAWESLMAPMSIRVSFSELQLHSQVSSALPEGGTLAWLGAFHQLHCVRLLRQFLYRDHYLPRNLTEEDMYHIKSHADHCLEVLRQAAMCAGDTSLTTMKWEKGKKRPEVDLQGNSVHWCVDWDQLVQSTAYRRVDEEELAALQNPLS